MFQRSIMNFLQAIRARYNVVKRGVKLKDGKRVDKINTTTESWEIKIKSKTNVGR